MILDLDEFLYSPTNKTFSEILSKNNDCAQIKVDWLHFGSNGHEYQPSSVVAGFTKRSIFNRNSEYPTSYSPIYLFKSIFKSECLDSFSVHEHNVRGQTKHFQYNDNKIPDLVINHYNIQSREFFFKVKATRGDVNNYCDHVNISRNLEYFESRDINEIEDLRLFEQNKEIIMKDTSSIFDINIIDLYGNKVNTEIVENYEQYLANKFIQETDIVLELGARYGSVSCIINSKLNNKNNQVVVEPDKRVWDALEKNRSNNDCHFNIVKGFISNKKLDLTNLDVCLGGYGATFIENDNTLIPSYSLDEIKIKYNLNFNVLVADCEGFLEMFFDENPNFYNNLRLIIFEADYPEKCNYDKIKTKLMELNFIKILEGHQNVWIK